MARLLAVIALLGLVQMPPGFARAASAPAGTTGFSCKGAILAFEHLGDQRLATYQDGHGHRIELWCTRRIFDSQFDLRASVGPARGDHPQGSAAFDRLATVAGCFFDNGETIGPTIIDDVRGAYAKVEWINEDPSHWRKYRFSYDFGTRLVTVTATVQGCDPITKVLAPQPSYAQLSALLPHPEKGACRANAAGSPSTIPAP